MVDIIIPTYGQEEYTVNCLKSIKKHTNKDDYCVVWVDNGSSRKSRDVVYDELRSHKNKKIIWLGDREGFVNAINIGLTNSEKDVVLLNNDTLVTDKWLTYFRQATYIKYQIIGCCTTKGTSRQAWDYLKHNDTRFKDMPDVSVKDINTKQEILSNHYGLKCFDIKMVAFFCAYITRFAINEVGLLDKKFKEGYSDDTDYCERAKTKGLKIGLTPSSYVHHFNNQTFKSVYTKKEISKMIHTNRQLLKVK